MRNLGQLLLSQREKRRISFDEIYKQIKIHSKYVKAMEADDYSIFDGKVHSTGFLKIYAEYLGLNVNEILALWRREHEADFERKSKKNDTKAREFLKASSVVVTPALVLTTVLSLLVFSFLGYLYYQYRTYTRNPILQVFSPENNFVTTKDIIDITGKTDLDSDVYINSQKLIANLDGTFATSIKLKEGVNTFSLKAENRLKKQTELIRTVIYRPPEKPVIVRESTETTKSK